MAIRTMPQSYIYREAGMPAYDNVSLGVWVWPLSYSANLIPIYTQGTQYDETRDLLAITTGGVLQIYNTLATVLGTTVIPVGQWTHIGFKRIGNVRTAYINGVEEVSLSTAQTFTKYLERIGGYYSVDVGSAYFGAVKMWEDDITDFRSEMYGYTAAELTNLHTLTGLTTAADLDNSVGGTDWTFFGTLVSPAAPYLDLFSNPAFLVDDSSKSVTVDTVTISGDDLIASGTYAPDSTALTVDATLMSGVTGVVTLPATRSGTNWSVTFSGVAPGSYTVRGRVSDSGGQEFVDSTPAKDFIGFSGTDELPYTYTNTSILSQPASATVQAGSTATFKAVNQAGAAIAGAVVALSNGNASAPALTDASGNVVVTGVAAGSSSLVLSIMNLAGATLSATVPLTITPASVSTVTLTPPVATLPISGTQQFTSVISGGGTTLWTVQSGPGSIDSNGLYSAGIGTGTAVVRATKSGFPLVYDESTITVTAAQPGIGAAFITADDVSAAPGESFSWQIKVEVDDVAYQNAVVTAVAGTSGILTLPGSVYTSLGGIATITGSVVESTDTEVDVPVTFTIVAGSLSMTLTATVSVTTALFGYLWLRGRRYPRPYATMIASDRPPAPVPAPGPAPTPAPAPSPAPSDEDVLAWDDDVLTWG